jgi:pimeloyl-ACP methyl ester carboxylesterase
MTLAFEEGFVSADGFSIRYLQRGSGEPLVYFHGAGGPRLSPAHEMLAKHQRVIAFEAPGFGQSERNQRTQSVDELARTMLAAIDELGIERFSLLGNSFGGRLALWLAVQAPERVQALVLVAPAAILPEAGLSRRGAAGPELDVRAMYAQPERQPQLAPPDPAVAAKHAELLRRLSGPPRDPELEARMRSLDIPTLVVWGTRDGAIPHEMGRHYKEILPNCHLVLVYDAAHLVDADRPEAFASLVGDFLERREQFIVKRQPALLYP